MPQQKKLTSEMCLLRFRQVWGLCALLFLSSSIRLFAAKPYQCVSFSNQHFPWAVYLDTMKSILKRLHYSKGIGQVQVQYFECKIQAKARWSRPGGSHFVLESSALFQSIKYETVNWSHYLDIPSFQGQSQPGATYPVTWLTVTP